MTTNQFVFPNNEAVSRAINIYTNNMRPFVLENLKREKGSNLESSIRNSLSFLQVGEFDDALKNNPGHFESAITLNMLKSLLTIFEIC